MIPKEGRLGSFMDFDLAYKLITLALPYEAPTAVETAIVSVLRSNGLYLAPLSDGDGVILESGMYAIYQDGIRRKDIENFIGSLFSIYSMSRELYDDLAAKMTVLRTLTQTISILAATSSTDDGIEKISRVISKETGFDDIIFALWDGSPHILYYPSFVSEDFLKETVEESVFSGTHKRYIGDYVVYPYSYATDDGIFFIGFLKKKGEFVRVEPELLQLLLYILIPFLRSAYLSHMAFYDALTGLLSRGKLMESLSMLWQLSYYTSSSLGILMVDIDHFKMVNDTYGHDIGDFVLKEVAGRIQKVVPRGTVVGRYGGEEFVIAMNVSSLLSLYKIGEAVRLSVADTPIDYGKGNIAVTISVGGHMAFPHSGVDLNEILKNADRNLYEAKKAGRNSVIVK